MALAETDTNCPLVAEWLQSSRVESRRTVTCRCSALPLLTMAAHPTKQRRLDAFFKPSPREEEQGM